MSPVDLQDYSPLLREFRGVLWKCLACRSQSKGMDRKEGKQTGRDGGGHMEKIRVSPGLFWSPCLALGD